MKFLLTIFTFCLAAFSQPLLAQNTIEFEHLTVEDGLPSNFTSNVVQDDQGFMWFATKNGLGKYDGSNFTIYKYDSTNPNSLSNNYTWSLFKDSNGNLWIATWGGGLNKFDPVTEKFTRYQHDPNNPNSVSSNTIQSICEDKTGKLWIATADNGLNHFDPSNATFTSYQHNTDDANSLSNNSIYLVLIDANGILWISTFGGGLNKFNPESQTFVHYKHDDNNPHSLSNDFIRGIHIDSAGFLWLATQNGLDLFDPTGTTFVHYQHVETDPNSLSHNLASSIYEDSRGVLWVGTLGGGLNQFDRVNNRFIRYQAEPSNPHSLSNNTVFGIHEDRTGTLWITTDNGVNKYDPGSSRFAHYQHNPLQINGLNENQVGAIYADKNNTLWLGTKGGGLNKFEQQTGIFTHYRQDNNPHSISNNLVIAIHPDRAGGLWLGTEGGGLNHFDPTTEKFTHYQHDSNNSNSLNYDVIWGIDVDLDGNVWIAFIGGGLDKFNPNNQTVTHYGSDANNPNSLITDWLSVVKVAFSGMVWIGTDDSGVNQLDPVTNTFTRYVPDENTPFSLSNGVTNTIFEDSKGTIWIGTNDGLNKFNKATQTFTVYQTKHGLAGNSVMAILEDNHGYLWISTDKGLSKFHPRNKTFRNYNKLDGLQGNMFLPRSAYKSANGEFFFGGTNGFNAFYPDKLTDNPHIPPVVLTDFQLFNKSKSIGSDSINFTKQITLSYAQSVFSFEFAALNYRATSKNQYAYLMAGFDKDWTFVDSSRRFANYTNLDAGKYTFQVKASNNDGLWNEVPKSIEVIILPPWWETWWAYALYTIVILGSILSFFAAQQRKLAHTKAINERLQATDKLKDEFLANTSHELRTPLNGIIGIAESLIDGVAGKLSDSVMANLNMIASSGRRLSNLVNDILDFSKLKQHTMELQVKSMSLRDIVEVVLTLSHPLKEAKDLQLINAIDAELPPVLADENRLQQILYNLVGNAIKFTESGKVEIFAKPQGDSLIVTVTDTGIGIPTNKLESIFEAFEQGEGSTARDYGGTGLGLAVSRDLVELQHGKIWAESLQGSGSQFHFTLPIAGEPVENPNQQATMVTRPTSVEPAISAPATNQPTVQETPTELVTSPASQSLIEQGEFTILVVDDEPVNRQVLLNHLSLQNYTVVQASNGLEALEMVKVILPDLILLDVMMPKMTGYTVCQKLREQFSLYELPILMLTAKNQVSDLVTGLDVGANDYLTKPVSKNELLARIKAHLSIKYLKQENLQMGAELDVSRRLQQMLLPPKHELSQIKGLDIAGFMEPTESVGGDYYDVLQHNGRVLITIGDVTGHGLESGALAIMVQSAMRALLANDELSSAKFLTTLNEVVYQNVTRMQVEKSLTLILLEYEFSPASPSQNKAKGTLRLSGQHEEMIVVRQGEVETIDTLDLGFPIGLDDDISSFISEAIVQLNPGDVVVLYTDGITEAENLNREFYGMDKFCEVIKQNWQNSVEEIRNAIIKDVRQFIGKQKVFDDITLLVLKQTDK